VAESPPSTPSPSQSHGGPHGGGPPPLPPAPTTSGPLFGRAAELAQLDQVFDRAVEYRAPQLITVVGTQGVGKTRLVGEWLAKLLARHAAGTAGRPRVYRGRGQKGAGSYSLINRLLRDRFGITPDDDEETRVRRVRTQLTDVFADRRLTEVLHFLSRFLDGVPVAKGGDNPFLRAVSFGDDPRREDAIARSVLRRFLELDAERSPLILAFDDLHVGDDDSLTLLSDLAAGLGGSPVVIVAASRPEIFVRRPEWGQGDTDHTRVDLGPLERRDAEALVRHLLRKAEPLSPTLVEDLCESTGGNPFFIEELVRVFAAQGILAQKGERWVIDTARAARVELPMTVEEAIEARIAALSPDERRVLEKAATLGSVFWLGALVVLGRLDQTTGQAPGQAGPAFGAFSVEERARIEATLEELVERDYLLRMPDSTVPGEVEYIFKHNLEHDLVGKLVPVDWARRYHLAAAEWLETHLGGVRDQSGAEQEFLAALYEKGGLPRRAAQAYVAAADKARERFAIEAAIELYERALKLTDVDDVIARIDPLHNYGDVLARAGRTNDALAAFRQMLVCAWRLDHHAKAGAAHVRLARLYRGIGDFEKAERHLGEALTLFRSVGDSRGVASAEDDLGRVAFFRGDYAAALERHGRSLDLRRALGDSRSIALSLHNLAEVHQAAGAVGEAVVRFSEALALRREIGDRPGVVQSLVAVAAAWRDREDYARALQILTEARELGREIGDRFAEAHILSRMGEAYAKSGREAEARQALAEAATLAQGLGDKLLESEAARLTAEVYLGIGDLRAARDEGRRALELAERVGSKPAQAVAHRILGTIVATGGITDEDKAAADAHFQKAIEILGEVGHELELGHTYQSYAHVLTLRGDLDGAETFTERADEITQRLGPRPRGMAALRAAVSSSTG